jgi:Ca2+-binding RTX toxin-like protein
MRLRPAPLRLAVLLIATSLSACATGGDDADPRVPCADDPSCMAAVDAGTDDAGIDAAAPVDAGDDAAMSFDAGSDAGSDAGTDAGGDAGTPGDAGRDAGPRDAGPPPDPCAGITCANHGWCEAGICLCDVGYAGTACDVCDGSWRAVAGAVPVSCLPLNAIDGTESPDPLLDGTAGDDYLRGLGGDDMIRGLDGSDYVNGNAGLDTVNGNVGRDEVAGGADDDTVFGGADDDVVIGGGGDDTVVGGMGNDRLIGGDGNDTLQGDDGDDRFMIDGLGIDRIEDSAGNDAARCVPGVTVISDTRVGADRLLILSSGGRVTIVGDVVERILGCN